MDNHAARTALAPPIYQLTPSLDTCWRYAGYLFMTVVTHAIVQFILSFLQCYVHAAETAHPSTRRIRKLRIATSLHNDRLRLLWDSARPTRSEVNRLRWLLVLICTGNLYYLGLGAGILDATETIVSRRRVAKVLIVTPCAIFLQKLASYPSPITKPVFDPTKDEEILASTTPPPTILRRIDYVTHPEVVGPILVGLQRQVFINQQAITSTDLAEVLAEGETYANVVRTADGFEFVRLKDSSAQAGSCQPEAACGPSSPGSGEDDDNDQSATPLVQKPTHIGNCIDCLDLITALTAQVDLITALVAQDEADAQGSSELHFSDMRHNSGGVEATDEDEDMTGSDWGLGERMLSPSADTPELFVEEVRDGGIEATSMSSEGSNQEQAPAEPQVVSNYGALSKSDEYAVTRDGSDTVSDDKEHRILRSRMTEATDSNDSPGHTLPFANCTGLDEVRSQSSALSRCSDSETSFGDAVPPVAPDSEPELPSEEDIENMESGNDLEDTEDEETLRLEVGSLFLAGTEEEETCDQEEGKEEEKSDLSFSFLSDVAWNVPGNQAVHGYGEQSELSSRGFQSMGSSCDTWGMDEIDEDKVGARIR